MLDMHCGGRFFCWGNAGLRGELFLRIKAKKTVNLRFGIEKLYKKALFLRNKARQTGFSGVQYVCLKM